MGVSSFERISTVSGFLAPPMRVPRLPIEQPYATLSMLILPKLLCFGTIFMVINIDVIIGRKRAATPCSGMTRDRKAQEHMIPRVKDLGDCSKKLRNLSAILLWMPCFSIAAAMINAPMRKKTAWLPNDEKTSFASTTPSIGCTIIIKRPVTASGIGSVIHSIAPIMRMPIIICPSCVNPFGVGRK